jgi:hypothetical protein
MFRQLQKPAPAKGNESAKREISENFSGIFPGEAHGFTGIRGFRQDEGDRRGEILSKRAES